MKKSLIISYFIFTSCTSFPHEKPFEEKLPFYITIHNHNDGSKSCSTSRNESISEQQTNSTAHAQSTNYVENMYFYYVALKKTALDYYNNILNHKYKIIAGLACAAYAQTQYKLYKAHIVLENQKSWCNWKSITPTEQLVCIHHEELISLLLCDMQKKYLLLHSKNHTVSSVDQFIKEISCELALLQSYIAIKKQAKLLYLSKIFYFSHKKSIVQEKINRLHIILDIFINWQTKELLK